MYMCMCTAFICGNISFCISNAFKQVSMNLMKIILNAQCAWWFVSNLSWYWLYHICIVYWRQYFCFSLGTLIISDFIEGVYFGRASVKVILTFQQVFELLQYLDQEVTLWQVYIWLNPWQIFMDIVALIYEDTLLLCPPLLRSQTSIQNALEQSRSTGTALVSGVISVCYLTCLETVFLFPYLCELKANRII